MQSRRKVVLDRAAARYSETPSADGDPRQGAKASFDGRNVCQKCFCVTFDESNKARAREPRSMPISGASMTDKRKGKIAYGENDKYNDQKRFCEP